ncbi:MAG: hypothetical protein LBG49_02035 [Mycoplasmataceae bacterium]|jgi:hypothetical protein|nr:hypothetical protein [Mycoplasmataceae bacterium]
MSKKNEEQIVNPEGKVEKNWHYYEGFNKDGKFHHGHQLHTEGKFQDFHRVRYPGGRAEYGTAKQLAKAGYGIHEHGYKGNNVITTKVHNDQRDK